MQDLHDGRLGLLRVPLDGRLDEVVHAALLHDIGKLAVDERILEKPSKLTDEEFAVIKTHPAIGEAIVSEVLEHKPLAKWIRHHHERMDGRGYPDNLPRSEIPIESRLIAVLDAYGWNDLAARAAPEFLTEATEAEHRYQGRLFWPAAFREEVLARLLDLNRARAEEERHLGLTRYRHDADDDVDESAE